jgi:hypothetical protein
VPEKDSEKISEKNKGQYQNKFISFIYKQKNDSPKYFEVKKSQILLFIIGLPTVTLIALILGIIGLVHTSPFHLIDNYRQNSMAREAVAKTNALINQIKIDEEEKLDLSKKLTETEDKLKMISDSSEDAQTKGSSAKATSQTTSTNLIGLSNLSLFRPIQGQKDLTRPPTINLSAFKVEGNRDTTNLQFNIIPTSDVDGKLGGYIIVLMKNELTIQAYPQRALIGNDVQISHTSGEPFSTQHFRPVDASFLKPRKPGNYTFAIYIFAKNGDLLHFQSVILPVKF